MNKVSNLCKKIKDMEMKIASVVNYQTANTTMTEKDLLNTSILNKVNDVLEKTENKSIQLRADGSIDLSNISPMTLHSILLETERLGASYSIEKSTVIRIN